jgi:DNA-binding response OmpR family regulator
VVDDNQDSAEMLAALLKAWGQDARWHSTAVAALESGREFHPEIVAAGSGHPHPDGYETARRCAPSLGGKDAMLVR